MDKLTAREGKVKPTMTGPLSRRMINSSQRNFTPVILQNFSICLYYLLVLYFTTAFLNPWYLYTYPELRYSFLTPKCLHNLYCLKANHGACVSLWYRRKVGSRLSRSKSPLSQAQLFFMKNNYHEKNSLASNTFYCRTVYQYHNWMKQSRTSFFDTRKQEVFVRKNVPVVR